MKKNNAIAILGGMGPSASVYLYELLIKKAAHDFGAKNNDDYPEILLDSIPVPDFISDTTNSNKALKMLQQRIEHFNTVEVGNIGIACNTVHILYDKLQSVSKAPIVSMIEEVANRVHTTEIKNVGILGSFTTITSELYQTALREYEITSLVPTEEEMRTLEKITRNVIAEVRKDKDTKKLLEIADSLRERGAEGIILGCTELPLVFPRKYTLPVFNSVEILAMALLQKYYGSNTIVRNL